ncbi:SARP family transcriptional regulator [Deinococcus sonorensis]|uniref:SARP family transcriptional regulator n=2 Tax=Deinococcus sonorensis TaxID=309891 RepID=A0AAU7UBA7_9DEIO
MNVVEGDFETLYRAGAYHEAMAALPAVPDRADARQQAVLGISLLRTGAIALAEEPLQLAILLGDLEASVEYGNLLRAQGRLREADEHLRAVLPQLSGELLMRGSRWLGTVQYQLGQARSAQQLLDRARRGYLLLGDDLGAAKIGQTIAAIQFDDGQLRKSRQSLEQAIDVFRRHQARPLLLTALRNLALILFQHKDYGRVKQVVEELETLSGPDDLSGQIYVSVARSMLYSVGEIEREEYVRLVQRVMVNAEQLGDYEHLIWAMVKRAELLLQAGQLSEAMRLLYQAPVDEHGQFPPTLRVVRAMINRRMGNLGEAVEELQAVVADLEVAGNLAELARVRLQLAYALHLNAQAEAAAAVLKDALQGLLRSTVQASMRAELEEMSELLHYAALEPSLAPYLTPVMDSLAGVLSGEQADHEPGEQVRLHLHTLGRISVLRGGDELRAPTRWSVPLLVYLALHPGRTVTEIGLDLWPDSEPGRASQSLRKTIQLLREVLGQDAVVREGPRNVSRYRLGPGLNIDLDLTRFLQAVRQGEIARALSLYRGEFLPGLDDSEWVRQQREEARLALTYELRHQLQTLHAAHQWRRLILLANQYLRVDPYDLEVHELRVEAARRVGTAPELARYVAAMNASGLDS